MTRWELIRTGQILDLKRNCEMRIGQFILLFICTTVDSAVRDHNWWEGCSTIRASSGFDYQSTLPLQDGFQVEKKLRKSEVIENPLSRSQSQAARSALRSSPQTSTSYCSLASSVMSQSGCPESSVIWFSVTSLLFNSVMKFPGLQRDFTQKLVVTSQFLQSPSPQVWEQSTQLSQNHPGGEEPSLQCNVHSQYDGEVFLNSSEAFLRMCFPVKRSK